MWLRCVNHVHRKIIMCVLWHVPLNSSDQSSAFNLFYFTVRLTLRTNTRIIFRWNFYSLNIFFSHCFRFNRKTINYLNRIFLWKSKQINDWTQQITYAYIIRNALMSSSIWKHCAIRNGLINEFLNIKIISIDRLC